MRRSRLLFAAVVVCLCAGVAPNAGASPSAATARSAAATTTTPLRILVTNDDGVAAPGLAVLVDALQTLPDVEVTVVAPATNQSGIGDKFTTTPITATQTTTANGDPATAISGTPADTVLYALKVLMPQPPHLVVSGTNLGQNLGDITTISGTVGAARTANRLGVPAIATSAGLGTNINTAYAIGAGFAVGWITFFRSIYADESSVPQTTNVNVPTCGTGQVRGLLGVPLGRSSTVASYTLTSGTVGNGTFQPNVVAKNVLASNIDCTSTATGFDNDFDAFNNGYITVSLMNPDLVDQ